MQNRFFTRSMLRILLRPDQWTLVSPLFPCAVKPTRRADLAALSRAQAHSHDRAEALFVLSGKGWVGCGGRVYPSRPGMVFFFPPGEEHDRKLSANTSAAEHLLIEIRKDRYVGRLLEMRETFREGWTRLFVAEELHLAPGAFFSQPGVDEWAPAATRRAALISALAFLACVLVERGYCPHALRERRSDFQREIVGAVMKHIRETAGREDSAEDLARMAGYSKFHFLRMFKQHAGKTVHEYVDSCRALRASEMLGQGALKKSISEALGFAHPSAFTRWLRSRRIE